MRAHYDFFKAKRGKFYREGAVLQLPAGAPPESSGLAGVIGPIDLNTTIDWSDSWSYSDMREFTDASLRRFEKDEEETRVSANPQSGELRVSERLENARKAADHLAGHAPKRPGLLSKSRSLNPRSSSMRSCCEIDWSTGAGGLGVDVLVRAVAQKAKIQEAFIANRPVRPVQYLSRSCSGGRAVWGAGREEFGEPS